MPDRKYSTHATADTNLKYNSNRKCVSVMAIKHLNTEQCHLPKRLPVKIYVNERCPTTSLYTEYCSIGRDSVQSGIDTNMLRVTELP